MSVDYHIKLGRKQLLVHGSNIKKVHQSVRDNVAGDGTVLVSSSVPEREETEIEPLFAGDVPQSAGDVPECAAVDSPVSTPERSATVSDSSESVSDVSAEEFPLSRYGRPLRPPQPFSP